MKVALRADASLQIGTGHVMRCLTLAGELKEKGAEVFFICREFPGNLSKFIEEKGYNVHLLPLPDEYKYQNTDNELIPHKNWLGLPWEKDAEESYKALVKQGKVDWLVVDHYGIDKNWEDNQKNAVSKLLVIDDLANREHCCDVLLDQNYYADMEDRYNEVVLGNCRKLLGPRYSLLRKEFREARRCMRSRDGSVHKIFVFFGGVDLHNMTGRVLESILELDLKDIIVDVVIGGTNPHHENIELLCEKSSNIFLHIQVNDMAKIMNDADLCIGSGGTVTWERCCLGVPAIAWPVAENQVKLLKDSAKAGIVYVPDSDDPTVDDIAHHINALLQNTSLCMHMSVKGLDAVDGKGASRVANIMINANIELYPAEQSDMNNLYEWRNDDIVRKFSRNSEIIDFTQHQSWFDNILNDPCRHILIGKMEGEGIGVLRFDVSNEKAEISIYLVPGKFGQGYGAALIEAGESWLLSHCPEVSSIIADVLPENLASNKIFKMCGYKLNSIQYQKSISK